MGHGISLDFVTYDFDINKLPDMHVEGRVAGADPGFLDRGFKFRKGGVRFPSFASFFLKFPMKMK